MKKGIIYFSMVIVVAFCFSQSAWADELSELKEQMKAMQKQLEEQAKMMGMMQEKIERLEAEKAYTSEEAQAEQIEEMKEKITALEAQSSVPAEGPKYLISKEMLDKFELGGTVELEFIATMSDIATGEPKPRFELDKVRLEPEIQIAEDIRFEADLDIEESGIDADEYYFSFANFPFNSTFQVGKDDRFFKVDRLTERYPLAGNAFWRDEELGFLWETEHEPFYGAISWSQGLELDFKGVGEDSSTADAYDVIHDDKRTSGFNGVKEVAAGLGFKKELENRGEIDFLVWGLYNQLSAADVSFLKENLNSYDHDTDDQYRAGVNLDYIFDNFHFVGQYIDAQDGQLDRYAWFVQPSYEFDLPFNWKYATNHRFLVRYGQLNVDSPKSFDKPASWDREELTFALITKIVENFTLKTEYTVDKETTGSGNVDNDEFVAQLQYEF